MASDKFNFYAWFSFNFLLLKFYCSVQYYYDHKNIKEKNSRFYNNTLSHYTQCIQLAEPGTPIVQ